MPIAQKIASALSKAQPRPQADMASVTPAPLFAHIHVVGTFMRRPTQEMFRARGYQIADKPEDADIILYLGGADINPALYGEKPIPGTYYVEAQDRKEVEIYNRFKHKALFIGICRGAQLLNVMNGGKMWQDVDHHNGGTHKVVDKITGLQYDINSLHHQQMIPPSDATVVAVSSESSVKAADGVFWRGDNDQSDIEVLWFDETRCLCFQAHPEFGHKETEDYFFELIHRYIQDV